MTPCMNSRFASPSSPSDVNDTHDKVRICTELIGQPKILNAIFHLLSLGKRKCSVDKSEEHQSADRSMIVVSWGWGCDLCNKRVLSGISLPSSFSSIDVALRGLRRKGSGQVDELLRASSAGARFQKFEWRCDYVTSPSDSPGRNATVA